VVGGVSASLQLMLLACACSDSEPQSSTSDQEPEVSTSGQEQEQGAVLVGTVELSFAASTRARYLTLNAPVVRAYKCLEMQWKIDSQGMCDGCTCN